MPDMGEKDEDRHMEGGKDLHQVTQPIPCMVGGAMLFCKPEDDAGDGARIEGKFKEWHAHWRVGEDVQKQYKPWEDLDLREEEEALLSVKALSCKATTGVGVDGVHPGVPLETSAVVGSSHCCMRWRWLRYGLPMPAPRLSSRFQKVLPVSVRERCFLHL